MMSMKNEETWRPTKVVRTKTGFEISSDRHMLNTSSRLAACCQIQHYYEAISNFASGRLLDITGKCLAEKLPSVCGAYVRMWSAVLRLKPFESLSRKTARRFPLGYVVVARKAP